MTSGRGFDHVSEECEDMCSRSGTKFLISFWQPDIKRKEYLEAK